MRKYILLYLLILISISLNAQAPIANTLCDNKVSTDWENPDNQSLPLLANGDPDIRFLNGLDWVNGDLPNKNYTTTNIYFTENQAYGNMLNVKPQTLPVSWYEYLFKGEEMTPNNGWELLLVNLGRYPDNSTVHIYEENKFTPYIVLYNRYEGTVRVFVTYGRNPRPSDKIDGVKIDLYFVNDGDHPNLSGLLRLGDVFDDALDANTNTKLISAVAKTPGAENRWYSADFKIAYDPCTCKYPSKLGLSFSWFSETTFALEGREMSASNIPLTQAQYLIDNDFLGNYEWDKNTEVAKNGYLIYENISNAIDDYIKQMEKYEVTLAATNEHNAKVKRNKAIAKAFKAIILTGANPASVVAAGVSITAALAGQAEWATELQTHAKDLIEKNDTVNFYKLSKEMKGLIGGQFDYFVNKNFKEKPAPTKPSGPSVGYAQMTFKGKLRNDLEWPGVDFLNPGTYNQNSEDLLEHNNPLVYKYPVYNDVLGTFALLESPKIILSETVENDSVYREYIPEDPYNNSELFFHYQSWTKNYQIKLASPLKYTFNSDLGIKSFDISASFSIQGKIDSLIAPNEAQFRKNCFLDPNFTTNVESPSINVATYFPLKTNGTSYHNGDNFYGNTTVPNIPPKNMTGFEVQTPFISKDAFMSTVQSVGLKNEFRRTHLNFNSPDFIPATSGYNLDFTVDLKLLVDIEYEGLDDDGNPNKVTQVFTYRIKDTDITPQSTNIINNLEGSQNDYTQFPENLVLFDKVFNGGIVEGCKLINNVYTCRAWNNITLTGNITANPGYQVNFQAANEINEINNCIIQGEIVREIKPIFDYSNPMPPVIDDYIIAYCDKSNNASPYKANLPSKSLLNQIAEETAIKERKELKSFNFALFPNPTDSRTTILVQAEEFDQLTINVFDIAGKRQEISVVNSGEMSFDLDVSNLSKGIYLVKVSTFGESKTKQLVIK